MSVPVFNVEAFRGGTITVSVDVTDSDGSVADLTGYTGEMQARITALDDTVLVAGTVSINTTLGRVTGVIDAADTADAEWSAAFYDIRISKAGAVEYVVRGKIFLFDTVTR